MWTKKSPGFIHHAEETWDVEETVTDADGRMTISAKDTRTYVPGTAIFGPEIRMFKGGYDGWQFRDLARSHPLREDALLMQQRARDQWEKFARDIVVIQLPPLKSIEERRRELDQLSGPLFNIPLERTPRWIEAYSRERVFLGLDPYPDKPGAKR
jgi:hypothetical protein